jgi:hypothetical protein
MSNKIILGVLYSHLCRASDSQTSRKASDLRSSCQQPSAPGVRTGSTVLLFKKLPSCSLCALLDKSCSQRLCSSIATDINSCKRAIIFFGTVSREEEQLRKKRYQEHLLRDCGDLIVANAVQILDGIGARIRDHEVSECDALTVYHN